MQGRTALACVALAAAVAAVALRSSAAGTGTYTPLSCQPGMSRQQAMVVFVTDNLAGDLYTIQAGQEGGAAHAADITADDAAGMASEACEGWLFPAKNGVTPVQAWSALTGSLKYSGAKYALSGHGYVITVYGAAALPAAGNSDVITAVSYKPHLCAAGMTKNQLEEIAAADGQAGGAFGALGTADYQASRSASEPLLDTLSAEQDAEDYAAAVADSASRWCDDLDTELSTGQPLSKIDPDAPGGGYADPTISIAGNGPW